jgi:NADH dehydrogenase (ubiquinone) 1 alpha subcomplex subunit 9
LIGQNGFRIVAPHRCDEYKAWPLRQCGDLGNIKLLRLPPDCNQPAIDRAVEQSDVVVNLIAQDRPMWRTKDLDAVNMELAARIAQSCGRHSRLLIHTSHLAARHGLDNCKYLKSKFLGEQAVTQLLPSAIIIRPGQLFGLEDRFVNALHELAQLPLGIPFLGDGSTVRYPVFVGDVAEAIHQLINQRHSLPQASRIFDLAGPHRFTMNDVLEWFNYYTMKRHKVVRFKDPRWMTLYSRLSINWYRPVFTSDLAISVSHLVYHVIPAAVVDH